MAGLDLVFVALAFLTNVAFGLAAIGTVALVDAVLARGATPPARLVLALSFGSALGFLLPTDLTVFGALAVAVLGSAVLTPTARGSVAHAPTGGGIPRGLVLALPLAALVVGSTYSLGLRLGLQGTQLSQIAAALLVLGPLAGLLAARRWVGRATRPVQFLSFLGAAAFSLASAFSGGALATGLLLFACIACLAVAAESTLQVHLGRGGELGAVAAGAFAWIPVALILFRFPPVVYSLTIVRLPEAVEALLYAPEFLLSGLAAVLALIVLVRIRREGHVGKGYPADGALRGGRSP